MTAGELHTLASFVQELEQASKRSGLVLEIDYFGEGASTVSIHKLNPNLHVFVGYDVKFHDGLAFISSVSANAPAPEPER